MVSLKTLMPVNTTQLEYDELEPLPEWKLPSLKPSDIYSGLSIFHLQATTSINICESVVPVANEEDMQVFIPILNKNELSRFVKKGHKFIHLELLQITVIPLFRHGIGAKLLLGSFDLRHTKSMTDCIISAMKTSLHDGPVFHNVFPNFHVSLTDPHINQILKICLKTQGIHMLSGSHSLALQYRVMHRTTNTLTPAVKNGRLVGQTIVMHSSPNSKQITHEVIEWDKVSFPENWLVDIHTERKALPRSLSSQKSVRELSSTSASLSFHSPNPEQVSHSFSSSTLNPVHVNSCSLSNNSLLNRSFLEIPSSSTSNEVLVNSDKPFHSDYVPNVHSPLLRNKSLRNSLPIPENSLEANQRSLETTMMSIESTSSKDEWYTTPKFGHRGYRKSQFSVYSSFDKWSSCETKRIQHLYSYIGDKSTPQAPEVQLMNWSNLNAKCQDQALKSIEDRLEEISKEIQELSRKVPSPSPVETLLSNRPLDLSKHVSTKDLDSYIASPQNQQAIWDLCTRKERSEKKKLHEESNIIECFDGLNIFDDHVDTIQEDTIQEEQSLNILSDTSGITLERMMEDDTTTSEPLHANIRTQNLQTQYYKIDGTSSDQEIREVLHSMFGWYATQIESLHKDLVDVTRLITKGFISRLREWWDTVLPACQNEICQGGIVTFISAIMLEFLGDLEK
eukprot:Gb_18264 [translate_table: standard]